ncbi:uncharacterized protein LOC111788385 [Cucurbita pepo subsp. pepo]|uniref:uncharacterized protein LOC111788385 n=1 Tax=Cucurbita pepo subsp. pepo TaxID=3664 RepID=UPI000C9DA100|nr:uncharacterized protein LOC111788385 [Cucurbita pepo subsp. pepo]
MEYIGEAGDVGCFGWRYSTAVKHAELKWAEKGPRRRGERAPRRGCGGGGGGVTNSMSMMSASQSPWAPATTSVDISAVYSSRFAAMSSPHSPAHRHHLPF